MFDNTVYLSVNSINESERSGEVIKKGCVLLDVQLVAEDIPCTFCTVQRRKEGQAARRQCQAVRISSLRTSGECTEHRVLHRYCISA